MIQVQDKMKVEGNTKIGLEINVLLRCAANNMSVINPGRDQRKREGGRQ